MLLRHCHRGLALLDHLWLTAGREHGRRLHRLLLLCDERCVRLCRCLVRCLWRGTSGPVVLRLTWMLVCKGRWGH